MNFYAHLAVASLFSEDLGTALGVMLPDFASLIGAKTPVCLDPSVESGYKLHHDSDRVFHDSALFRGACAKESSTLLNLGLHRGAALAAAHVGVELLLDDALGTDEPTYMLFRRTLEASKGALVERIRWSCPEQTNGFENLCRRLEDVTDPAKRQEPIQLAERISRTLSRRPRLAVRAIDRGSLETWARGLSIRSSSLWPKLIDAVIQGLVSAGWHVHPGLERGLRFRRASSNEV